MKVENRLENSDAERYEAQQRRVGREAMQRIANPFSQTTLTALKTLEKALSSEVEKTTGHFANQDGTLKTLPSGWACFASIICGALVWVYIAAGWL
jgi:hypothetical protein